MPPADIIAVIGVIAAVGYLLVKVRATLYRLYPVEIRIVTRSDWTALRVVGGASIVLIEGIEASPAASVADYSDQKFRLNQVAGVEADCGVIEMSVKAQMMRPIREYVRILPTSLQSFFRVPNVEFEIDRGHWGWTHVQISNRLGGEPVVVGNYWWSGISSGAENVKTISLEPSKIFSRVAPRPQPSVTTDTLVDKVMFGYQGWFLCPGDGSDVGGWHHWFRDNAAAADKLTVDMWPDASELGLNEKYATDMVLPSGAPAELFSSYNEKTVVRHFQWMKEHGIDGVFLQRFVTELDGKAYFCFRNKVTQNVVMGAERHGRVFALMYDISGSIGFRDTIKNDWMFLVDVLKITESPNYLRHRGRPVVAIWGLGFNHVNQTPTWAKELIDWFHSGAPSHCQATVMGGVPTYWRTLTNDSRPDAEYADVYRSFDVISPWTVGRYRDNVGADLHRLSLTAPDLAYTSAYSIDYMPVIWPGFSWHNLQRGTSPLNDIPRRGGEFYWRQAYNAISAGAKMLYVAMFDECDEGTAMFKLACGQADLPVGAQLVPLDIDGHGVPSDWYLQLGGKTGKMLRGEIPLSRDLP